MNPIRQSYNHYLATIICMILKNWYWLWSFNSSLRRFTSFLRRETHVLLSQKYHVSLSAQSMLHEYLDITIKMFRTFPGLFRKSGCNKYHSYVFPCHVQVQVASVFHLNFHKITEDLIDPVKSQPPHKTEVNKKYLVYSVLHHWQITPQTRPGFGAGGEESDPIFCHN